MVANKWYHVLLNCNMHQTVFMTLACIVVAYHPTRSEELSAEKTPPSSAALKSAPLLAPLLPQVIIINELIEMIDIIFDCVQPLPVAAPVNADYGFRYAVNDFKGNEHSHQQKRVGNSVTGQYKVLLPDGRLQTVTYIADENGYRAKVDYTPGRPGEAATAGLGVPPPPIPQAGPLRPPLPGPFNVPLFAAQKNAEMTSSTSITEETQGASPLLRRDDDANPTSRNKDILDVEQVDLPSPDGSDATEDEDRPTVKRGTRRLGSMAPIMAYPSTYSSSRRADRVRFNTGYARGPFVSYRSPYTLARFAY